MQELRLVYKEKQRQAVASTDINTCVSAGAGTGKTFVLVQRFIQLLKENKAGITEIAAITFTEKAAKEMKDRIRAFCGEKYKRDLENARIGTIHSFCARILRENPVEAGIDPKFRVLDEAESISLIDKITHKEILRLLAKEDTDTVFMLSEYGLKETKNILKMLIKKRIDIDRCENEFMHMHDQEIIGYWQEIDRKKKEELIAAITRSREWLKAVQALTEYSALNSSCVLDKRRKRIIGLVQKEPLSIDERAAVLLEIRRQCIKTGYRKNDWHPSSLNAVLISISALRNMLEPNIKYLEMTSEELDLKGIQVTRRIFRLYKKIQDAYTAYKKREGFLDFDDLIIGAKKLLKENKYIRKACQNSIKYLLVDEYQDTDFHQREIIFYLAEETSMPMSDSAENIILSKDKLFIVGDHKQSIYRFRGADVSVFENTRRIFRKAGKNIDLEVSFRGSPQNISFFNDFFGKIIGKGRMNKQDYEADYTDIASCRNIKTEKPQLEFLIVNEEELSAGEARQKEAELIAGRIKQMVQNHESIVYEKDSDDMPERPKDVRYKDIAILFRAMTNIGVYEQAFRKYNIPYYILSGSGFFGRQEIKDILNYLKVLDDTCDNIALAGILRSPMVGISDDVLYHLRQQGSNLFEAVNNAKGSEKLILCRQTLNKLRNIKNRISIASLITEIIRETDYYSILITRFMGAQRVSNIKKLIDTARRFEQKGIFTLGDFIKYINEFVTNEVREGEAAVVEEESNVVKMMTIHKAKGLEFPVVIIPDISKSPYTGWRSRFLYDRDFIGIGLKVKDQNGESQDTIQRKWIGYEDMRKDLAESKRLLYVASTRVKDYLIYSGRLPVSKRRAANRNIWANWFLSHYNLAAEKNGVIELNDKIKAKITTAVPVYEEKKHSKPLAEQYNLQIKQYKQLPCPIDTIQISRIIEQIQPITRFYGLKDKYTATEFTDYIKCPKRYELSHIINVPWFQVQRDTSKLPPVLLGVVTHKFFEKWNLNDEQIPKLLSEIEDKRCITPLQNFIETFKKSCIYKELKESAETKTELAVTFRHNEYMIEGVIDKLYKTKTGWALLDYKTDDITKEQIPERAKAYEIQLQIYALGITKVLGITAEKAVIFFLSPGAAHTIKTDNAGRNLTRLINQIQEGRFQPISSAPLNCPCPYKRICLKVNGLKG